MKIEINTAQNGFIIILYDEDIPRNIVVEEPETEKGELEVMKNLLWIIKEELGIYYSKHNKYNLDIIIKKNKEN
jgi:hypothetical protein